MIALAGHDLATGIESSSPRATVRFRQLGDFGYVLFGCYRDPAPQGSGVSSALKTRQGSSRRPLDVIATIVGGVVAYCSDTAVCGG